jgi:hypothetical protein
MRRVSAMTMADRSQAPRPPREKSSMVLPVTFRATAVADIAREERWPHRSHAAWPETQGAGA